MSGVWVSRFRTLLPLGHSVVPTVLAAWLLLLSAGSASAERDISIENSSAQGISFKVVIRPDLSDLSPIAAFDSSTQHIRLVQVGVPYGARVRVLRAEGRLLTAITNDVGMAQATPTGEPLVSVMPVLTVRGRQIATVRIAPMVGQSVYCEVAVELVFEGGAGNIETLPVSDPSFDRMFRSLVINFDQWRGWGVPARAAAKPMAGGPLAQAGTWYKIAVTQSGLCRVTGAQLQAAGLVLTNLASDSIRLFNGGGLPLEMRNERARPTFREVALRVDDGGDGLFGNIDQILFYAEATNRWRFRVDSQPVWVNNVYESENFYWLAVSGDFAGAPQRMATVDGTPVGSSEPTFTTYRRYQHVEQDKLLLVDGDGYVNNYYTWYWSDSTRLSMYVDGSGISTGDTALVYVEARTGYPYLSARVNGIAASLVSVNGLNGTFLSQALATGLNNVVITLQPNSTTMKPYFNFLELQYRSRLLPQNDRLDATLYPYDGTANVEVVDNFSVMPLVFALGVPGRPVQILNAVRAGGVVTFSYPMSLGTVNRYCLASSGSASSPASITRVTPVDLYAAPSQTDLTIITPRAMVPALDDYAAYRRASGHAVTVVPVEEIFDNFSFGMVDPTAIRDYLKFTYESYPAPAPSAVLLVGDANYDYLDRLGTGQANLVPSYINPIENVSLGNSYGDDNYVYFGAYGLLDSDTSFLRADRGYDMMIARWPVKSAAEIATITQKIRNYEAPSDLGDWRDDITLVADDEFGNFDNETFHTTQTEELSRAHIPAFLNRQKIYLWDYPFVNQEKPAVNDAIVKAFNDGTLIVNYVGHGNPDVWAHEYVFTRTGDLPRLHNTHLPLVFAASCAIGFFDDPQREAMGEDLLGMTGGAVGVVAAMRLVFSSDNSQFNRQAYDMLLYGDSLTIGEAIYAAKLRRQYSGGFPTPILNDRSYVYLGDPYLRLGLPRLQIQFTETPDSLTALGRTTISGRVEDADGNPVALDGTLTMNILDSDRQKVHRLLSSNGTVLQEISYTVAGPTLFRGSVPVAGGQFSCTFVTPLDVNYGGRGARISAYAVLGSVDAAGLVDSLPIATAIAASTDSTGPVIRFTVGERRNPVDGMEVRPEDNLRIEMQDSSGINLAGTLGHGITLEIDNRPEQVINLTDLFATDPGDFTSGSLEYSLALLGAGDHTFKIKAWDNANNSSTIQFSLRVAAGGSLAINELLNVPNPMKDNTTFYFELTQSVRDFQLEIFSLSGRKIRTYSAYDLHADNYPNGQTSIIWDGRDAAGGRVASGVYLYKVTATPADGGGAVESFGKVVVVN